ncbi:MAG: LutB/LldF family L-lactate oxidation iron-sulfur protein [Thiolinea sp.]
MTSEFRINVEQALKKDEVRAHFRKAMDMLMTNRRNQFPQEDELQQLRTQAMAIRANALSRLPELLERLESNLTRNGIHVHWAETTDEANQIVLDIMRQHGACSMIKGKSMVSEEMGLNHFLEEQGIEALESDLGEFIIQLDGEAPSHIIMPAIHKSKEEISRLFNCKFPDIPYTDNVDELANSAREILREKFYQAPVGLSGVNFAVAETGTLCLVENEGNGRMSTTVPPVHIAVTGIEKVVESLSDIPPLLSILPRSATGQPITTYFNMISGPRKPDEKDGPQEVHLVLLDNGRSRIYSDPELLATLRCIRCGACINHCPVYVRIGGHSYGTVYPGPIGTILEPQKDGLKVHGELVQASSLCGACGEVCPVKIPIPGLINRLRHDGVRQDQASHTKDAGTRRKTTEALAWQGWSWSASHPRFYNFGGQLATRFSSLLPANLGAWTRVRSKPQLAARTLHQQIKALGVDDE